MSEMDPMGQFVVIMAQISSKLDALLEQTKPKKLKNKICKTCGEEYTPKRSMQMFCSADCRVTRTDYQRDEKGNFVKEGFSVSSL